MPALLSDMLRDRPSVSHIVRWLLTTVTAAYVAVLLWTTHAPRVPQPQVHLGRIPPDKLLHFSAYAVLGMLAAMTTHAWGRIGLRMLPTLFAMLAAFAAADEVTQPLFGRAAEATDWVADVAGIAVALAVWAGCRQVTRRLRMTAG
jgi:VanZ family protein